MFYPGKIAKEKPEPGVAQADLKSGACTGAATPPLGWL